MRDKYDKIDAPTEDTVIFGGRTLKQIVSIMDRLEGILEIIDVPDPENRRRSIFTRTSFFSSNPRDPQWSMQHLLCYHDLSFQDEKLRPIGWSVWDMYIAHHVKSYQKYPKRGPVITCENLGRFIDEGQIAYVIAPHCDASRDLDALETLIAKCDERLVTIGEWVRLDLCMRVKCACGRSAFLNARDKFHVLSKSKTTLDTISKMRCTSCGASNIKSTTAYYRDGNSAFWKYSKPSSFRSSRKLREPLDELYINLGGDGENAAYLGDGLYVDPDGRFHE